MNQMRISWFVVRLPVMRAVISTLMAIVTAPTGAVSLF